MKTGNPNHQKMPTEDENAAHRELVVSPKTPK
jgi:hypothetical protein